MRLLPFLKWTCFTVVILIASERFYADETPDPASDKPAAETSRTDGPSVEDVRKAMDDEAYEKAVELCSEILEKEPKNSDALALRGKSRIYLDQEEQAKSDFEEALRWDPKNVEALYGLGYYYSDKQPNRTIKFANAVLALNPQYEKANFWRFVSYCQRKEWDKAAVDCEQLQKLHPREAEYFYFASFIHYFRQDLKLALSDIDKAIEIKPDYRYYEFRALCLAKSDDMEKAIADYRESKKRRSEDSLEKTTPSKTWNAPFEGEDALLIDNLALLDEPDNVGYLLHRAATQYSLGQFDAAFADAVRAKELKKDSIGAYALCAEIYAIRNDLHAALAELEKGLRAVPNDLYLICLQANALKQLGNVDQATADIENAVRIDAKFASYYAEWGVELASQNRFDEAMAILNRVLELAPQCPQALEYRAKIQYSRKEWQSAQADLRQWAAFQPNEAEAFWLLAGVDLERQRLNDAIENLNLALEIDPEYVPALLARAQCLKEMNRYEEAMIDATEYVRLKPHDDEGLRIRGEIFYSLKKFKQAIADLDEAVRLNPQSGRDYFSRGFIKYGRAVYLSHTARYGNSATQAAGEPSASWSPWPAQSSETSNLSLGDGISKSFDEALDAEKMTEPNSINNPPPSIAQPLLIYPSTDVASAFDSEIKETERLVQTKLREALADLDEAVKLAPDSLTCHRTRLKICSLLYDDDAAVSSFDALIRLDPKNIQAYLERGDLHSRKHRYDEALADFQKVIDLDPENQSVYCRRACVYAIQGEEKKAEADLTKTGDLQKKR